MLFIFNFLFSPLPTPALIFILTFGTAIFLWLINKPQPVPPPVDLDHQSVGIEGGARRGAYQKNSDLLYYYFSDVKTLYEAFQRGLAVSDNGPCLGYRKLNQPYRWLSYKQVSDRAEYLGSCLLHKGYKPSPDQFVGIFAQNRPEWVISELACYTYSMVAVPLYDTLGADAIIYIVNKADIATVICDTPQKASSLIEYVEKGLTPSLKMIILMDPFEDDLKQRGERSGVEILSLFDAENLGKENFRKPMPPKPEDLSIICFTSGTTGDPKGAMLTHQNIVANAASFLKSTETFFEPLPEDVVISYLPLAHMFERIVQTVVYSCGARVGFFQGDIRLLPDDMKTLQPTVFPTVPRLLNRIYDKVQNEAKTPLKKFLLNLAVTCKFNEVKKGIIRRDSLWDKLIFSKIQASLGGKVRFMITGAAPISSPVLTFLRAAVGCQVFEAYGQTECSAGCTITSPGDWMSGHVGVPLACNHVKLEDVPDMNYFSVNNEGEVCIRGTNVFKGYLKDPQKTDEALDKDGWLHTGDIGRWLPNGTLKIIDRKKNIFKLAQGEYIAPEKIENIYIRSRPVLQIFVHGDSLRSSLVGVVIPDPEVFSPFAAKLGVKGSLEELCQNQVVKEAVLEDLQKIGKESGLKSFEQVKNIFLHPEQFTIENGLLTPTMKAKRGELAKYFRAQIDSMYLSIHE
ncbi:long-chain-fatty-acid--CoA ligase 5 [Dasypus novemcinctus]|uniref:long-chain-fatty-acid--CoA ligase 5 n=1 Tax=Dasypus novemcinctus TaxID=9361 RepID=UPI00265D81B8|nr:long-chain-fatty-acid--CoA ligase 5 [Dasypus novemcinctus]XP_058154404.1 long-chain-fatty-acid--CoA ligase 5 [Dasypus novemcinctus]XP_058154405.1 long-chain-fatty-acid--CoA ligase 5 [Dasypus novemcinctus]XP_058154406.1 long-chain-fatty-acid--CoA ligase 5 [Dasypus novemcinctus]XP_058154407.1 long-chain-fatty-acid--CoA ligase 5 [Dasypus novemcinctus]